MQHVRQYLQIRAEDGLAALQEVAHTTYDASAITSPQVAHDIAVNLFHADKLLNEIMLVLSLDARNRVISAVQVAHGAANQAAVMPSDVYRAALLTGATAIMVVHNHPSGDVSPSVADISATRTLQHVGKMLGVQLLDHLIIGKDGKYTSMKREGIMV